MEDRTKKNKASQRKPLPKALGIAIFYGICILVAIMVLTHNNPLAPDPYTENLKKYCACALLALACIIFGIYYDRMFIIPKELFQSRELIWKLAKNDFKKRYAGSYLGFLWALVQPVVTVVMYWIVFDRCFKPARRWFPVGWRSPMYCFLRRDLCHGFISQRRLPMAPTPY